MEHFPFVHKAKKNALNCAKGDDKGEKSASACERASEQARTNAKSQQGARSVGLDPISGVGWERAL